MNKKPNFVFFGTPLPAVEILEHLEKSGFLPSLVVTNPDRPQGRKMISTPSPVKVWAEKRSIPVKTPEKLSREFEQDLHTKDWDIFIVVAYGKIIPKRILDIPKHGSLNVHYSFLPKYRGASPIESQILADDPHPGISIILLDEKMDHGPILATAPVPTKVWPTSATLLRKQSNEVAGKLLVDSLSLWLDGKLEPLPQNESEATYTKKFTKEDGLIDLSGEARKNYLKFLAFLEWPGTYFFSEQNGRRIRVIIKDAEFKDNSFIIKSVIPEGRKGMPYKDFLRGKGINNYK